MIKATRMLDLIEQNYYIYLLESEYNTIRVVKISLGKFGENYYTNNDTLIIFENGDSREYKLDTLYENIDDLLHDVKILIN